MKIQVVLSFLSLTLIGFEIHAQENYTEKEISKIGMKFDSSVESRTRELMRSGISSWVNAFKLAYQGIDSSALNSLKKEGIDIQNMFVDWPPRLELGFVLSDWILFGKITQILLIPGIQYNKYVYVKPTMWLKGKPIDRQRVVIRTSGSGPADMDGKIWSSVSHEAQYKDGDPLLLLLNRASWELESEKYASFDQEQFKDDYPHMCFEGWGKLLADGEYVVSLTSDRFEDERGRWRVDSLVATIRHITTAMERSKKK